MDLDRGSADHRLLVVEVQERERGELREHGGQLDAR
jgi:hypothetical protein